MEGAKGLIITGAFTLLILFGGIFLISKNGGGGLNEKPRVVDQKILVREDSHGTASPSAAVRVTVVEFGDYRCPACKAAFPVVQKLIDNYKDKINFVFRNFAFLADGNGLITTKASTLAANAAECAGEQNKFWEMHDWLYQNQPDESDIKIYTIDNLTKVAGELKMDTGAFKKCLTDSKYDSRVKADYIDGQAAGVTGTPTFFVNGQMLSGVPSYDQLKLAVDSFLNK